MTELKLKVSMPFGTEPTDIHPIGAKVTVINSQVYTGAGGGDLLYVEFENKIRTWIHEKHFE